MLPLFNYYKNKSGRTLSNNLHIFIIILIIVTILMFIYIDDFRKTFVEKENNTSPTSSYKVNYNTNNNELNKHYDEIKKIKRRNEEIEKYHRNELERQKRIQKQMQIERESYRKVQEFYDKNN